MKKILTVIIIGLLCFSMFSMLAPKVNASSSFTPDVVCVPFNGQLAGVPHDAWIGKEIILKGTAHDKDGDGTMTAYKWDFGDGYSTDWISGVNPYIIEAKHTYTGTMADGTPYSPGKYFTAWLYVKDNELLVGKDSYFIAIREKTLDVEVNLAIDNGLWWLNKQQVRGNYPDGAEYGYWNSPYGYYVASTSACTEAFELQGHLPSGDLGEDPYVETVQRGLNYLFNQFHTYSVYQDSTYCPLGNPDVNGNGIGLGCYGLGEILYESGMALMTISSTGTPNKIATTGSASVVGRAYKDIVQDMIDWFAWGQNDPIAGVYEGGWRYQANYEQWGSDNSVSQWPVIGMEAAERNFGSAITVPSFVRPELAKWLSYSQNLNGGFGYDSSWNWVNTAKTGAGCAMLSWIGVPTTDSKFQNALGFLDANWYYSGYSYTNFGDYYTMYAIMKGMRIANPNVVFIGSHDWYAEYARYIVDEQNNYGGEYVVDHSWLAGYLSGPHATAWALATLTLTVTTPGPVADAGSNVDNFPPIIPVKFDASGSYHRDPTKSIVLYEWDFESDGIWDYSFGSFVYPTGLTPTVPGGKQYYGYDGACTYYNYAGWLARGDRGDYASGSYHIGQDIQANEGDNVYAIADGYVTSISGPGYEHGWDKNVGDNNLGIVIRHKLNDGSEFLALYGHVHSSVSLGQHLKSGEVFATIGPFGSEPHLHFGIHPGLSLPGTNWGLMSISSWPDANAHPGDPNGPDTNGFVDPIEWITKHISIDPSKVEHAYPAYYNPDGSIDWDATAKDYTATLRVTDNSDPVLQDTDTCIIHITAPPWKPVADPDGPYEGYEGVPIQLDGSKSYDPESKMYSEDHPWYETIAKYEWDLDNDGQFDDSTQMNPSYTWTTKGTYSVGLRVTDSQPSGPGGTIGPLDVDIMYTTVVVSKQARRFNPLIDGFWFENYVRQTDCLSKYTVQQIYDKIKSMFPAEIPTYLVLAAAEMLWAWKIHEAHCFGMAKTSIYYYDHQIEIPASYSKIYDILDKDDVPAVRTKIENYQHEQVFGDINAIFNMLLYFELNSIGSPLYPRAGFEVEVPAIITMSQQLKPALLALWGTEQGGLLPVGHAVVAYECKQVDDGYDVSTYDSNMHGQNHIFKFRRDTLGRLSIEDDGDPWFVWKDLVCLNAPLTEWTWDYVKDNAAHLMDWIKDNLKDLWDEFETLANQMPDLWNQFTEWTSDNAKDVWNRLIKVKLFSHAQLSMYDPSELHVGLTSEGDFDQEFDAMFAASNEMQFCVLPYPEIGDYAVQLIGISKGSYTLSIESIAQGVVTNQRVIENEISEGEIHRFWLQWTPTQDLIIDSTPPSITVHTPLAGEALQDGVTLQVSASDSSTIASVTFSIQCAQGNVISPEFQLMPATLEADGKWGLYFDTRRLPDGFYVLAVNGTDVLGNSGITTVPFSIRNWASIQLLPSTPNSKAGRTMPIKFSIRVKASVDPAQPFIFNEELTIKIYRTTSSGNVLLQTSTFGSSSKDYRIDQGTLYITNFKTLSTPAAYLVEIYRKDLPIGSFQFNTVK